MPSDDDMRAALAALASSRDRYRSALATTLEEVRTHLDRHQLEADERVAQLTAELGQWGSRLVHAERLAALALAEPAIQPAAQQAMRRALKVLEDLAARGDDAFALELPPGESLYQAVATLLADFGRAMGAARVVEAGLSARYRPGEHDRHLRAFPFGQWSQAERLLAPPIVVALDGADLRPAGLAEFLDGSVRIALIARGETSPAPLVRLITPRAFVAQADDAAVFARLARTEGPGIVALMPPNSARFVHDPAAGPGLSQRLTVGATPHDGKKRAGPFTAAQQREELEQLKALQAAAAAGPAGGPLVAAAASADPVDKLAAWLLQQADLSGA